MLNVFDVLIVGAGPAGLACGLEARARGLSHIVLDKGTVVNTIVGFPTAMTFFSTPDLLELGGMPFTSPNVRPTRVECIEYYTGVATHGGLNLRLHTRVEGGRYDAAEGLFHVNTQRGEYLARNVVLATGYFDTVNRLGVSGEDLPKVSHYYLEPYPHFDQDVVVIGGRNSAVEAALDLWRHGARVTLVHRGEELGRSVKYWVRPDIDNRISKGEITAHFNTEVVEVLPEQVVLRNNHTGERTTIANDAVYALIGYRPDVRLLDAFGITYDPDTLIPTYNSATFATNVPGLYIAGSVGCGAKTWEIFIENGRRHAQAVIAEISAKYGTAGREV